MVKDKIKTKNGLVDTEVSYKKIYPYKMNIIKDKDLKL